MRPYSYLVPSGLFPEIVELWDDNGKVTREVTRMPLRDTIPTEGVQTGPRSFTWQNNAPGGADVLLWAEALDGGDPKNKVPRRDRIMRLAAPFDSDAQEILKTEHRYSGMSWFATAELAMVSEYDRDRRWRRTWICDLSQVGDRVRAAEAAAGHRGLAVGSVRAARLPAYPHLGGRPPNGRALQCGPLALSESFLPEVVQVVPPHPPRRLGDLSPNKVGGEVGAAATSHTNTARVRCKKTSHPHLAPALRGRGRRVFEAGEGEPPSQARTRGIPTEQSRYAAKSSA